MTKRILPALLQMMTSILPAPTSGLADDNEHIKVLHLHLGLQTIMSILPAPAPRLVDSVLKSGPVWSFTPILRQLDYNWTFDFPDLRQSDLDCLRLVHVGLYSGPN